MSTMKRIMLRPGPSRPSRTSPRAIAPSGSSMPRPAARALAPKRIRVNGIAPGLTLRSSGQSDENYQAMHAGNPLRRGVEPADVIGALRYLIDAPCVTGQVLVIDSGQRFMALGRDVQFLEAR